MKLGWPDVNSLDKDEPFSDAAKFIFDCGQLHPDSHSFIVEMLRQRYPLSRDVAGIIAKQLNALDMLMLYSAVYQVPFQKNTRSSGETQKRVAYAFAESCTEHQYVIFQLLRSYFNPYNRYMLIHKERTTSKLVLKMAAARGNRNLFYRFDRKRRKVYRERLALRPICCYRYFRSRDVKIQYGFIGGTLLKNYSLPWMLLSKSTQSELSALTALFKNVLSKGDVWGFQMERLVVSDLNNVAERDYAWEETIDIERSKKIFASFFYS